MSDSEAGRCVLLGNGHVFTAPRRLRLHHGNATPENWRCALHPGSVNVTESSPARPRRGRRPSRPHPQPWGRPPRGPCPFHLCAAPRTRPSVPRQRDGTGRKQTLASRRAGKGKTGFYDFMIYGAVYIILSLWQVRNYFRLQMHELERRVFF